MIIASSRLFRLVPLFILILLSGGCATSNMIGSWKDPSYRGGKVGSVLVIVATDRQITRQMLEDEIGKVLATRGVQAVPSFRQFPNIEQLKGEQGKRSILGLGLDGVLVSRLTEVRNVTSYVPPGLTGDDHFDTSYQQIIGGNSPAYISPGMDYDFRVFGVESSLYDVRTKKMIWSALTETPSPTQVNEAVRKMAEMLLKQLVQDGLM